MALETLYQRLSYCLWHLPRGATNVHYATLCDECVVYPRTMLTNEVLDVNFLTLDNVSEKYIWGAKCNSPDPSRMRERHPKVRLHFSMSPNRL